MDTICLEYPFCDHNHGVQDENTKILQLRVQTLQSEITNLKKLIDDERQKSLDNMNTLKKEYFEMLTKTKKEYDAQIEIDQIYIDQIKKKEIEQFEKELKIQEDAEFKRQEEYKKSIETSLSTIITMPETEPIVKPVKEVIETKFKLTPATTSKQVKKTAIPKKASTAVKKLKPVSKPLVKRPVTKKI